MRAKLPWILLAVSLALNLGFAAGAVYYAGMARPGDPPANQAEAFVDQLSLDAAQRAALETLREKARARWAEGNSGRGQWRLALLEELAKPDLQPDALRQTLRDGMERRVVLFEALALDLHDFLSTLSPEQKEAFLALAKERGFLRKLIGAGRRDDRDS